MRRYACPMLLFAPFGSTFASGLADGCELTEPKCLPQVVSFLKSEARHSAEFMARTYKALQCGLSIDARVALHTGQQNWRDDVRRECRAADDPVEKASCFGDRARLRGVQLDERLAEIMDEEKKSYVLPRLPMTYEQPALGVTMVHVTYYKNTDVLTIKPPHHGLSHFSFTVNGGNQHVCSGEGRVRLRGHKYVRVPDPDRSLDSESRDLNRQCEFEVNVLPHHVRISGNYECHVYFACGERIALKHVFIRTDR